MAGWSTPRPPAPPTPSRTGTSAGSSRRWAPGSSWSRTRRWSPTSTGCSTLFDEHGIRGGEPRPPTDEDVAAIDAVLPALNDLLDRQRLLGAYLYAHTSTDARDDRTRPGSSRASRPTWPGSAR